MTQVEKIMTFEDYVEGDFEELYKKAVIPSTDALFGEWTLHHERSEPIDDLLAALGIGMLTRAIMRKATPRVSIQPTMADDSKVEPPAKSEVHYNAIRLTQLLPLGKKKQADIPLDGSKFSVYDDDTNVLWNSTCLIDKGRIMQRRVSEKGIMYDVRGVINQDPLGKCNDKDLLLFKWSFIDAKTKKHYVSHRFYTRKF